MKRIVIGLDDSDAALTAARFASELVTAFKSTVTLVYVIRPVAVVGDGPVIPTEIGSDDEVQHCEDLLRRTAAELNWAEAKIVVKIGAPAEVISDVADEVQADLVVIGSTGKGAVQRLFLGSTADRLLHISKRPVLVVR